MFYCPNCGYKFEPTALLEEFNKIQQLEKENKELKEQNKYLDGVSMLNEDLIKENAELKAKLTANRFIFNTFKRNEYMETIEDLELQRDGQSITIGQLKQQLSEIKTLDENEVDIILTDMYNYYFGEADGYKSKVKMTVEQAITAICKLAVPEIDLDPPCMPPNETFPITIKVAKIEKGEPSIV